MTYNLKKYLRTTFSPRQYMLSKDFEIYYYDDTHMSKQKNHTHDYYEFYFFLEGNVSIQVEQQVYPVSFGDMIVIPPGVSHRPIIRDDLVPYRRFVFWISAQFYQHLVHLSGDYGYLAELSKSEECYIFHNDRITFNTIQSKILRLINEMQSDRFGHSAQVSLYVSDLLLHINRLVYERNHPAYYQEPDTLYQRICFFIEEHIDEDLSLDRLAKEFFASKYHIAHIFKDNLGLSVHQYITKKRLALCRNALLSEDNITDTIHSYGFKDYSSFFRAFKKEFGISPKEYREENNIKGLVE